MAAAENMNMPFVRAAGSVIPASVIGVYTGDRKRLNEDQLFCLLSEPFMRGQGFAALNLKEVQFVYYAHQGFSEAVIARTMGLERGTYRDYLKTVFAKLGVDDYTYRKHGHNKVAQDLYDRTSTLVGEWERNPAPERAPL